MQCVQCGNHNKEISKKYITIRYSQISCINTNYTKRKKLIRYENMVFVLDISGFGTLSILSQ